MDKGKIQRLITSSTVLHLAGDRSGLCNLDLIRCTLFGQKLARLIIKAKGSVLIEEVINTGEYYSLPFYLSDSSLEELIDKSVWIYDNVDMFN